MKFSYLFWSSMVAAAAPASGQHVSIFSNRTHLGESRTIREVIKNQERFVLYNSRHLTAECIPVCIDLDDIAPRTNPPVPDTRSPTLPPTGHPTKEPTKNPTREPTKNPTREPTKEPTKNPTREPTSEPTKRPTAAPKPVGGSEGECTSFKNLGYGFSEATGNHHYTGKCFPHVSGLNVNDLPERDDSVSVFVGGNYVGNNGAEVEGTMVVLGNLQVNSNGPANFVSVGAGTHVHPNSGGDCIVVGGDLKAYGKNKQVFNQHSSMYCDIVYKGGRRNVGKWKTNGNVRKVQNYDLSHYEEMKTVLSKKSQFWKTLPENSYVEQPYSDATLTCNSDENEDISVFNIKPNLHHILNSCTALEFSDSCEGKTILINVLGSGTINIKAAGMRFKGKSGYGTNGFSTCLTESILWNFPDASQVNIGYGGTSEFHGSILAGGNLKLATSGHSGRTMVLGNLVQDHGGSEFHSYQYAPPTPLPDASYICEPELTYKGNNGGPKSAFPLGNCEGDCDNDSECKCGLKCFQRDSFESVPGCHGQGTHQNDYCYVPPPSLKTVGNKNWSPGTLGHCEGDCDNDSHCKNGLKCFQRDSFESVPGCDGQGTHDYDYCYYEV